jgi:hypothetical protein
VLQHRIHRGLGDLVMPTLEAQPTPMCYAIAHSRVKRLPGDAGRREQGNDVDQLAAQPRGLGLMRSVQRQNNGLGSATRIRIFLRPGQIATST